MVRQSIYILLSCLLLLSVFSPTTHTAKAQQAKVAGDTVMVREKPSTDGKIITKVHKGDTYQIIGKQGDWTKIKLNNGKTGWIASWLIQVVDGKTANNNTKWVQSTVDSLRVREGPSLNDKQIGYMNPGQQFKQIASVENWIKIQYGSTEGWVSARFVKQASTDTAASKSVSVNVPTLNLREAPSTTSAQISQLKEGQTIQVLEAKNGWYKVKTPNGTGWVTAKYTTSSQQAAVSKPTTTKGSLKVNVPTLNVRQQPNTTSKVTGAVHQGNILTFTAKQNGWYQIKGTNQTPSGWVIDKYVSEQLSASQTDKGKTKIVTANILNIRQGPSLSTAIIGKLNHADKVIVLEQQGKWSKIKTANGTGWVYNQFLSDQSQVQKPASETIKILNSGTNLRSKPSLSSTIVGKAEQGETYKAVKANKDWYEITLGNGQTAYVAAWIVAGASSGNNHPSSGNPLKGKTIIIDPGHGGRDGGTSGYHGTIEKSLTLKTSLSLAAKLKENGAKVILTRTDDRYIPLSTRVSQAHYYNADAFISLHYDSIADHSVNGLGTFYYNKQKDYPLAEALQRALITQTGHVDRKAKFGDYHVLRENQQPAALIELGFLSNSNEEAVVKSNDFQSKAVEGVYKGLVNYFKQS